MKAFESGSRLASVVSLLVFPAGMFNSYLVRVAFHDGCDEHYRQDCPRLGNPVMKPIRRMTFANSILAGDRKQWT